MKENIIKKKFTKSRGKDQRREQDDFETVLVNLRAVSKTRTGGRVRSFSALVLVGNKKGLVGVGSKKSTDVLSAIQKAELQAKKNTIRVNLHGKTISHNVRSYFCGVKVIANKTSKGTGLKAGGAARKVLTLAGIEDISLKCIGNSMSAHNVVYAVLKALKQTTKVVDIAKRLNLPISNILERAS